MTERDEQGFVKDIDAVIDTLSNEEKTVPQKVLEILNLPFSVEDVLKVENFVVKETNSNVDIRDDLYKLAILNEQLNGFDDMFKSKLEERHNEKVNEIVEALNIRMEGVNNMYDENLENVAAVDPTVEQPVEVPTPQLDEISPEAPVVEVGAAEPIATFEAEPVVTTVDPTAFAEPTSYGEVPTMDPTAFSPEMTIPTMEPVMADPTQFAEPVAEVPVMEPVVEVPPMEEMVAPVMEPVAETPVMEVPAEEAVEEIPPMEPMMEATEMVEPAPAMEVAEPSFSDFINGEQFTAPAEEVEAPVEATDFQDFINNLPEANEYAEPEVTVEAETPVEATDFQDFINNLPVNEYEEPVENELEEDDKEDNFETPEVQEVTELDKDGLFGEPTDDNHTPDDEEDEEVKEIINRYDRLKELEINVHNNQKRLVELQNEVDEVQLNIENDKEEIKRLVA